MTRVLVVDVLVERAPPSKAVRHLLDLAFQFFKLFSAGFSLFQSGYLLSADACREFLADVEQNAQRTNDEVLGPITGFAKNLVKAAVGLASAIASFDGSGCKDVAKIQQLTEQDQPSKTDIAGIVKYFGRGPISRIVGCNGKIYAMTADFSGVQAIANLFGL